MNINQILDHLLDPSKPFPKEFVPTNQLRFERRKLIGDGFVFKFEPVLQQLWRNKYFEEEAEWRDVPSVDEETK